MVTRQGSRNLTWPDDHSPLCDSGSNMLVEDYRHAHGAATNISGLSKPAAGFVPALCVCVCWRGGGLFVQWSSSPVEAGQAVCNGSDLIRGDGSDDSKPTCFSCRWHGVSSHFVIKPFGAWPKVESMRTAPGDLPQNHPGSQGFTSARLSSARGFHRLMSCIPVDLGFSWMNL